MVAAVALPVESIKANGVELLAPTASFQLLFGTAPATSVLAMGVPRPTKSILMTLMEELEVTFSVTLAECVSDPLVPVIVIMGLPVGVLAVVVMVSVELPDVVMYVGAKEGEAPVGKPVAAKLTWPLKPFRAATFTV